MTSVFRVGQSFIPASILPLDSIVVEINLEPNCEITTQNDTNIISPLDIKTDDTLFQEAAAEFSRLFKQEETPETVRIDLLDESDNLRITFHQLAQKRLLQRAEDNYNNFLATREEKLRAETRRLEEIERYNAEFAEKLLEAKQKDADKKREKEDRKSFFRGLLFGDPYDESIPRPSLAILHAYPPQFFALKPLRSYRVSGVDKIEPVRFDWGGGYYRPLRDVTIKCRIKPRKHRIFHTRYRSWCQQFVRKIIEKRQRGPPSQMF